MEVGQNELQELLRLDFFSLVLPLPYRVACILVLGIWAWGINLHYLHFLNIDVPLLIRYPHRHLSTLPAHHLATYRLAFLLTIPLPISLILFWTITQGDAASALGWEILPNSYLLFLVACFLIPVRVFSRNGRLRVVTTLRRVAIGGLANEEEGRFGDILMADVLTSYAKVLGDLFVSFCMFFSSTRSSTGLPDRTFGGNVMVPVIISIPSLIRLRQCLTEYRRVQDSRQHHNGWGGQHLANAAKYLSTLPVIILSAMQRGYSSTDHFIGEAALFKLWLLFAFFNSFYSFYWDVAKDWDLTLFSPHAERNNPEHAWGLRRNRMLGNEELYYAAIAIDFLLRCTWSFKLSPHLNHFNDLEGGIFMLELLEVFRRWIWIFLRVETEWARHYRHHDAEDIPLPGYRSEYIDKIEDD